MRKVITASWRVFFTTKTLTESGGKGGQNRFESAWVRHFGDSPRKIRPIYEVLAAARCCTQQSVHEYARHECRTPRGARGGVQARPTARFVPFCPVSHKKRSLINFLWHTFNPRKLSQSELFEFAKKTGLKRLKFPNFENLSCWGGSPRADASFAPLFLTGLIRGRGVKLRLNM